MPPPPARNWIAVSDSRFPWEQEALDFIHEKFPAGPDYLAWSNFEFIASDGSINETDLLIASPLGRVSDRDQEPARSHQRRQWDVDMAL